MREKNELGIYIHIPFCKKKCYYCDFISFTNKFEKQEQYIKAVQKEIKLYNLNKYNITTIYIGGGTPSSINEKYIKDILEDLKNTLVTNETKWQNIEITIELNPGTVTKEKLELYKSLGINRLSIGLQETNNKLLKQIGRIHTYEEFLSTYNLAKQTDFKNINIDLMIGLPDQTIQNLKETLEKIIELNANHISIYSLIVENDTIIDKLLKEGKIKLPDEENERRMYWYVKNFMELSGYNHYEISNFAKEGKESKHNINCWEQKEYIGIGVSAHSYLNNIRYCNTDDFEQYINNINKLQNVEKEILDDNSNIYIIEEVQTSEDKKKEYMLLGLRKIQGVNISKFKEKFIDNPIYVYKKELEKLVNEKLVEIDGNFIRLTNKGLDLANLVWEEFI